jgi:ATP-dependent protease Clp ATPase subunit
MSINEVNINVEKIIDIFVKSDGMIKNHSILTGSSGSGKTFLIEYLANKYELELVKINAAGITKEGVSGNSLTKALTPLSTKQDKLTICFIDEMDKLFVTNNQETTHASNADVQNEFLYLLENNKATITGDYGKFISINTDKVLYLFSGAFNNEENITMERLKDFKIRNEFLGRISHVFSLPQVTLENLLKALKESRTLQNYFKLYKTNKEENLKIYKELKTIIEKEFKKNTYGFRLIDKTVNNYFLEKHNVGK